MGKGNRKKRRKSRATGPTLAERADPYRLYELSVQEPEADIEFAVDLFRDHFGRRPHLLREDFCGSAALCRDWVREHRANRAWGIDLDEKVLDWGRAVNVESLKPGQRERIRLLHGDVRTVRHDPVDLVLAQNFSYTIFDRRKALLRYFRAALRNLRAEGILLLDLYGGPDSERETLERTEYDDFTYVWDQHTFDPVTRKARCHIHFEFPDRSRLKRAFTYEWRLYTVPEIREALVDAGFVETRVYWEGTDPETGEGDGVYTETEHGDADEAWVCYVAAFKR